MLYNWFLFLFENACEIVCHWYFHIYLLHLPWNVVCKLVSNTVLKVTHDSGITFSSFDGASFRFSNVVFDFFSHSTSKNNVDEIRNELNKLRQNALNAMNYQLKKKMPYACEQCNITERTENIALFRRLDHPLDSSNENGDNKCVLALTDSKLIYHYRIKKNITKLTFRTTFQCFVISHRCR